MKKLHLAVSKDNLRPHLQNIQIRNGYVYATNCHILVKFPINEVFGEDSPITKDDHFYINGKEWGKFKFYNAERFTFENDILSAMDHKGNNLGMIKVKNKGEIGGEFADCDKVIYAPEKEKVAIDSISFDHELYYNLIEVFNFPVPLFNMSFYGQTSQIYVKPNDSSLSNATAIIMPMKFINQ
jgi:hypothetical protein